MTNKDKIEQSKKSILDIMSNVVDNSFKELYSILSLISEKEKQLVSLTLDYTNLEKDVSDTKKFIDEENNKLNRNKAEYLEDVDKFKNEVNRFNKQKEEYESNLSVNISKQNKLLSSISALTHDLKTLETKLKAKEVLSSELESIKEQLKIQNAELLSASSELESINKQKISANNDLLKINLDIENRKNIILPTIEELNRREKSLDIREKDLQVVIERYKKLYAANNAGFKID